MSQDKMPAILNAVKALPVRQRGLALGLLSALCEGTRFPNAPKVFKEANKVARTPIAKAVVATFDSSNYFVTRNGLYVWPEFIARILPAYTGLIPKRGIKGVGSVDLTRDMYDREIVMECLGDKEEARKHAFTPDQLADLIDAQEGGKAGILLNNGNVTILYMIGVDGVLFPVHVRWFSGRSDWLVLAYDFDGAYWSAGDRVLRNKH